MAKKYNTLSILSIIFAFIFSPVGLVLGIIALSQIKKSGERGKGLAIFSIIWGAILLMLVVIGILWVVIRNVSM